MNRNLTNTSSTIARSWGRHMVSSQNYGSFLGHPKKEGPPYSKDPRKTKTTFWRSDQFRRGEGRHGYSQVCLLLGVRAKPKKPKAQARAAPHAECLGRQRPGQCPRALRRKPRRVPGPLNRGGRGRMGRILKSQLDCMFEAPSPYREGGGAAGSLFPCPAPALSATLLHSGVCKSRHSHSCIRREEIFLPWGKHVTAAPFAVL